MQQKLASRSYKTITYKLVGKGKRLIIVFPRASGKFSTHIPLVNQLKRFGTVLFLESGYFGISTVRTKAKDFQMDRFCDVLRGLIKKLSYKKVILIGESVGAMHALNVANCLGTDAKLVILGNPALYRSRLRLNILVAPLLMLGLYTSPDLFLKGFAKFFNKLSHQNARLLADVFVEKTLTIGGRSYLSCLKEIGLFPKRYQSDLYKKILAKTVILKGGKDKVFDFLCNENFCRGALKYKLLPSAEHDLIDHYPTQVTNALKLYATN